MLNSIVTEGASEHAIMDILLENDLLVFSSDTLIENSAGEVIHEGLNAKAYSNEFLSHAFQDDITVHVVMDDPKRQIKLKKYSNQISVVKCYITREEIEAIHLHYNEAWSSQYSQYKQKSSGKFAKPSAFFKAATPEGLGIKTIKKYEYVYRMWSSNPSRLVAAIYAVQTEMKHKKSLRGYPNLYYLADLIK